MADSPYIPQYKPTIFIGGFWLDDARGIEFQVSDPKEPLYGFRDVQFRQVARGQTVVHGILDLNFRFKGYLSLALARLEEIANPEGEVDIQTLLQSEQGNDFRNGAIDPRDISAQAWRDLLENPHKEFDIPRFVRLSDALKEQYWDDPADLITVADRVKGGGIRPRAGEWPSQDEVPKGFDMTIVYQHPDPFCN